MSILLLGMLYSSRAMGMAQPLHLSPQATSPVIHMTSDATTTCIFNGVEYFVASPSSEIMTCESILRDAAMTMANSANDRSVTSILWSCLATVFACTWVSVHPNIPHPNATAWKIRRHRLFLMICGLIAPEVIILWALRQWMGARCLVRKMKEKNIHEFTVVHGHFMQMGGFMLHSRGARIGVIEDYNQLASCIIDGKFSLPTAEEIQDRSKGDSLSKALIVGQTAWFVAQCLFRWIAGLAITEMELLTLAFAALNGIIYFLWWNKPLDVRYAVQVFRQAEDNGPDVDELPNSFALFSALSRASASRARIDDLQGIRRMVVNSHIGRLLSVMKPHFNQGDVEHMDGKLRISFLHCNCDPQETFAATAVASAIGIFFGAVHCIAWNFHFISHPEHTLCRICSTIMTTIPTLLLIKSVMGYFYIKRFFGDDNTNTHNRRTAISRIGCTSPEVVGQISRFSIWATILVVPVYIAARVGLLVQALFTLRDLQPAERAQVQWANFVPHS
ncbi:hypothetical protein D9619_012228 [Psilocybe cf. subviscida]|uniref:Uncharacterized protein n=1 Tax=Psilocybe cf. subviscida TaxID=2480587 RepID=A0A8H5B9K8_9AGAR|nr:hypothetical protein D9619_012228 [Psilocybe cf. subviscida]